MGSFNIQCCVSKQIISEGNPCYIVPILQSRTYEAVELQLKDKKFELYGVANSMCSPDSLWQPVAPFIEGVYNDYGGVAPIDTPANRRAMLEFFIMLLRSAPVVAEGENSCHDVAFNLVAFTREKTPKLVATLTTERSRFAAIPVDDLDFEELTDIWGYVEEVARESRLFCGDYSSVVRPVQFAVVHKAAAGRMKRYVEEAVKNKDDTYELKQYLQNAADYFETRVSTAFKDNPDFAKHARQRHIVDSLQLHQNSEAHKLLFAFYWETADLVDGYFDKVLSISDLAERLSPMMTGVYVMKAMNWLNLQFSPIAYAGQDYDNTGGKMYVRLITEISQEVTRQQNERHGELDDDDEDEPDSEFNK